ncbi:unnamed protein product [Medioppia subpectinata]|uniref:Uncharacterized protein n=1 Tax=Medioppia subpectinata TaxID=1979941 RepID=A0A7R9KYI1_9ACAR|nr:unnamed protein product [Medioppia subpectinata]CAG2111891.1 unnamed protein product [Medioppia subpectinata]
MDICPKFARELIRDLNYASTLTMCVIGLDRHQAIIYPFGKRLSDVLPLGRDPKLLSLRLLSLSSHLQRWQPIKHFSQHSLRLLQTEFSSDRKEDIESCNKWLKN